MKIWLLTIISLFTFCLGISKAQGTSCSSPITLDANNNGSTFSQSLNEKWFSFLAPSELVKLQLQLSETPPISNHVHSMYVFQDNCADTLGYILIDPTQQTSQDTLVLHIPNLVIGQKYRVQIVRKPSCAKCVGPVSYQLTYSTGTLNGCNWTVNSPIIVIPGQPMTNYGLGYAGYFPAQYYTLLVTQTSGNIVINNFLVSMSSCNNNIYGAANNYNGAFYSAFCLQGVEGFYLSGVVDPSTPPGTQMCLHFAIYTLLGTLVCENDLCFIACEGANAGSDLTVCEGDCPTLTASGATNFDWFENSIAPSNLIGTGTTISVCPSVSTQYFAVPTQDPMCGTIADQVQVTVVDTPLVNFSFTNENCQGHGITFTNTTNNTNSYSYLWNFGDGSTSTNVQEFHSYSQPGTYTVTLTSFIANLGCSASHIEIVNITPDMCVNVGNIGDVTYNCGCCSYSWAYTLNNFTIGNATDLANFNLILGANGNNISIKDYLVINSDMVVSLNGTTIEFGPWGGIIIEAGSQLTLDGCVMKGLNICGTMWQGIHVYGDNTKSQILTKLSTGRPFQGKLVLVNGSVIRDAHNGITVGKIISGLNYDGALSGGIVDAGSGTQIINCGYSIKIFPYSQSMTSSRFEEIHFNDASSGAGFCLDPGYWSGNTLYLYNGPNNPFNPNYGYHNVLLPTFFRGNTSAHVMMFNIRSIKFWGCDFRGSQIGVNAWNCKFNVQPKILGSPSRNSFTGINSGVQSFNWWYTPFINQTIQETDFLNVKGNDLWITGSKQSFFNRNTSNNNTFIQSNKFCSVYYSGCGGIFNYDNNYTNAIYGVRSSFSTSAGGIIGYASTGNIFTECKTGIQAASNPNLQIRCNSFVPSVLMGQYISNWVVSVILPSQGTFSTTDNKAPAGNEFLIVPQKQINSNTPTAFTYYRHSSSVSSTQSVTPIPIGNLGVVSTGVPKVATSCVPPCSGCGIAPLTMLFGDQSELLVQLDAEITTFHESLDGNGQTTMLLNAINGNTSNVQRQQLLISNSPLSDQVILALINRQNPLPNGHFKNIMERNMPVADSVWIFLSSEIDALPPGIANQLRPLQFYNVNYVTHESLQRKRNSLINQRQLTLNQLILLFAEVGDVSAVIALLEGESTFEARATLVSLYLEQENPIAAKGVLETIEPFTIEQQAFVDLNTVLVGLEIENKTIAEISQSQEQIIREVATIPEYTQPVRSAQAILNLLYGEPMPDDTLAGSGLRLQSQTQDAGGTQSNHLIEQPYPIPSIDNVMVPCTIPEDASMAVLNIFDATGKLVETHSLTVGANFILISTSSYGAGPYLCSLNIDGSEIETTKFQVVHQ